MQRLRKSSLTQKVSHLEHDRVQHRFCHCVDVRLSDFVRPGIGTNFTDFTAQCRHRAAGDIDEIGAQVVADSLFPGSEVTTHPGNQIPLLLLSKLNHGGILFDSLPQLFHPLVGLPLDSFIGKNHSAILGNIADNLNQLFPVTFRKLKQVNIVHLHKGMLCHHGKILHGIGKRLQVEGFVGQAVIVKGFRQLVQQKLLQLLQIVTQQKHLFAVENIEIFRLGCLNGSLQPLNRAIIYRFRHGLTS